MEPALNRPTMVVSSSESPEAAAHLAQSILQDASEDTTKEETGTVSIPFITPPPDTLVRLPGGGILDPHGGINDEAEVRELTGADEEILSKAEATKSMARYVQMLVKRGTVRIGSYEKLTDDLLSELLIGDREALILAIRRATYGDELKLTVVCPACTSSVEVTYDLATEIPTTTLEDPTQRVLEVSLRKGGVARVRIPTCEDQDAVFSVTNKTLSEMNSMLMARCLVTINGQPAQGRESVLALGIMDRQKIVEVMNGAQPGPKYNEVQIECPSCGAESPLRVRLLDLFRG